MATDDEDIQGEVVRKRSLQCGMHGRGMDGGTGRTVERAGHREGTRADTFSTHVAFAGRNPAGHGGYPYGELADSGRRRTGFADSKRCVDGPGKGERRNRGMRHDRGRNRHRGPCDRREKGFRHPAAVGHSDHGGRYDAVDSPHRAVALAGIRATRECLPTRSMERGTGSRSGHFG